MNEEKKRVLLSTFCHGSTFFSSCLVSFVIPLAIFCTSKDRVVRANAKEALNFHLAMYIWAMIGGILTVLLIGFLILPLIFLLSIILPIFGIIAVINKPNIPYRYPWIFRLIK